MEGCDRGINRLAELKNERIQASQAELARSLEGNWREEQLFVLATGDFIRRRANLVFVGWSGVGKSHIRLWG